MRIKYICTINICKLAYEILVLIATLSDIPIFYIKYLIMHKVHMHAGAIRQFLWLFVCTGDNPLAKARGLPSRTYAQTIQ